MHPVITYYIFIIALTLVIPNTVLGECKVTDTGGRYIIVCSGNDPSVATFSGSSRRKAGKPGKANFESRAGIMMSEEEQRIMETNNHIDGYRSKRKVKVNSSSAAPPNSPRHAI